MKRSLNPLHQSNLTVSEQTLTVHGSVMSDQFGSNTVPIYQTAVFDFKDTDEGSGRFGGTIEGYKYSRIENPTVEFLEQQLAKLEGVEAAMVNSSGMGSISSTVLTLLCAGDHLLSDDTLYGSTYQLFVYLRKFNVEVDFIDFTQPDIVTKHLKKNTKVVYFETMANPTMKLNDVADIVAQSRTQENITVIVDATFTPPVIFHPSTLGVDLVIHSLSKFINGHGDSVGGVVLGKQSIISHLKKAGRKDMTGSCISPNEAFLIARGLMTIMPRVLTSSSNALKVAQFLEKHQKIEKVFYVGLESHPKHELAKKQFKDSFGTMIAFEVKGGLEGGKVLLNNLKVVKLAVSLGSCVSLIQHPASMTHTQMPIKEQLEVGITQGLVRFSVGLEDPNDIIADLSQALENVKE